MIIPAILPLLRCKLVNDEAFTTLASLVRVSAQQSLQPFARDLADSIRIIATVVDRPLKKNESEQQLLRDLVNFGFSPIQRLLKGLQITITLHQHQLQQQEEEGDSAGNPVVLLPSSAHMLYPIVRGKRLPCLKLTLTCYPYPSAYP